MCIVEEIKKLGIEYSVNEVMKNHTTFKIGGPVKCMVFPKTIHEIRSILSFVSNNNINFMTIGKGSNLLFDDAGFDGVIIKIADNFAKYYFENNYVVVESGIAMSSLATILADKGLAGFEPLSGIPGTVGGAIMMNAGAYESEISEFVEEVVILDENNNVVTYSCEDMKFAYRKSILTNTKMIVLQVKLRFSNDLPSNIKQRINEYYERRASRQPLEFGSAGSMFKRPVGYFAGKLVDDAGLRGFSINDAQVSEKHAGFIINKGNATFDDVMKLVKHVQKTVFEKFNVMLEQEVKVIKKDN